MLVIHRSGTCSGGMGRYYCGSGMVDTIGRKMFSSGVKKAVSSGASSAIAHKVTDAVVNGVISASKTAANAIVKGVASAAGKAAFDSLAKKVKQKRSQPTSSTPPYPLLLADQPGIVVASSPSKRKKRNIDSLIDGSGIVYD